MKDDLKNYVYALMDPRDKVIFYIGKGKGDRAFAHMIEASSKDAESQKVKRIQDVQSAGHSVRTIILARDYENSDEAFAIESALIIQARNSGNVMGLKSDLTNIARGHHEGRFRPWSLPNDVAGFEYKKPQSSYAEAFKDCLPLYDYIIQTVPEFANPKRKEGSYIRSEQNAKGFEFVVYPKQAQFIHFEYIGRKSNDSEQLRHAEQLRRIIGYGGDFNYPKIDYPRHDLSVDRHEEVAKALMMFISDIQQAERRIAGA